MAAAFGEIFVLAGSWRRCTQRFFLTTPELTFGSCVSFPLEKEREGLFKMFSMLLTPVF